MFFSQRSICNFYLNVVVVTAVIYKAFCILFDINYAYIFNIAAVSSLFLYPSALNAQQSQDLDKQQKALNVIADFADRICTKIPLEGKGQSIKLSGEAKAEVNKVLKQLADLGVQGTGEINNEKYQGLVRSELLSLLRIVTPAE